MSQPRILMVSSEASPYAKSGGLADVVGALPMALARLGHPIAVVLPRYTHTADSHESRVIDSLRIPLGSTFYDVAIWQLKSGEVTFYFIDHVGLYNRHGLYGDQVGDFPDNHVRFAVLCKAALEVARVLFPADIYHCHDWQAALLPVYLKNQTVVGPNHLGTRTVLTIHNLGYQGLFERSAMRDISLPDSLFDPNFMEFWGKVSSLKAGIVFADALTTVSRKYAEEIQTPEYGFGLDGLLRRRRAVLTGIVNGVDYGQWNPETDPYIPTHYSAKNLNGKQVCKRKLLTEMGLPDTALDRPLLAVVSRFTSQKGFDLIADVAPELFQEDIYLAALGNGEPAWEDLFRRLSETFPGKVAVEFGYTDPLAHRIEAGADIALVPSRYEPCGLNQIYSLRYGTVPVVRATGGLDDTINAETGFKFAVYSGQALLDAIRDALAAFEDREGWKTMMERGMQRDFSWTPSAAEYSKLYGRLHPTAR